MRMATQESGPTSQGLLRAKRNNRERRSPTRPSVPLRRPISISPTSTGQRRRPLPSPAAITSSPPWLGAASLSSLSHFFLPLSLFLDNPCSLEPRICPLVDGDPPAARLGGDQRHGPLPPEQGLSTG
jgi:hypothetical protein